jgi:hypothetical protein
MFSGFWGNRGRYRKKRGEIPLPKPKFQSFTVAECILSEAKPHLITADKLNEFGPSCR